VSIDVAASSTVPTDQLILYIGVAVGVSVIISFVVVFVVLWRIRNKKGVIDDENYTPASVERNFSTFTKKFDSSNPKSAKKMKVKLIVKLDSGGFGEVSVIVSDNGVKVWKGKYMGEPVAVKMILKSKISVSNKFRLVKMMNDEAELMHKLNHPRIGKFTSFVNSSSFHQPGPDQFCIDFRIYAWRIIAFANRNSEKQIQVG
jgi:serine/threonine protein kinase